MRAGSRTSHKVGTRVGVGAQGGSCLECDYCKQGLQQHCEKGLIMTYQGTWEDGSVAQGGYADFMRCRGALAVPIPDGLESETTAPLLCAGVTVYAPLKRFNAGPGKRVGVIGIGGLGAFPFSCSASNSLTLPVSRRPPRSPDRQGHGRRGLRSLALCVQDGRR